MKKGWVTKKLGEVCGLSPPKSEVRKQLPLNAEVSFVPMDQLGIEQKHFFPNGSRLLSDVIKSYTYFANGDVLLAKITPCFENGKLGVAKDLLNGVGFGSSEYFVIRPNEHIVSDYIYYFLSQTNFRKRGAKHMTGAVGHKRVPYEFLLEQKLLVPEVSEQQRIVAILDAALADLAQARANAEKSLANAKDMFASELHSIFTHRGEEWRDTTLDRISENLDYKRIPITKSKRKPGPYPYYGASGIVDYVAEYIFEGDKLLISEDGANLLTRSTPVAFSVSGKFWVNNHAHILSFEQLATQFFVEYYFASIKLDDYVTGAAQPKLNQKALNSIPIPLPPLPEQQSIVARLDELSEYSKKLEAIYRRKLFLYDEMKQSLLHKALSGEL